MAFDVSHLFEATTVTTLAVKDHLANQFFLQVMPCRAELAAGKGAFSFGVRNDFRHGPFFQCRARFATFLLAGDLQYRFKFIAVRIREFGEQAVVLWWDEFVFFDVYFFREFFLQVDDFLDDFVRKLDRIQHDIFGDFAGEPFDHGHCFFGSRYDDIQLTLFELIMRWEGDKLTVNASHPSRGYSLGERERGDETTG